MTEEIDGLLPHISGLAVFFVYVCKRKKCEYHAVHMEYMI